MTLSQFIALLNKTKWDVTDFNSPDQCFDLIVGWCDNIKIPRVFPHLYAYQIYTVWSGEKTKYFDRIENTPEVMPQAGDIIAWKLSYNGTAGHTAVATGKGDLNTFEAFSQNDPTDSPCITRKYSYDHVHGWLRPKHIPMDADTTYPERDKYDALIRSFTAFNDKGRTNYYSDDPSRLTADIIAREETIEDLRSDFRKQEQDMISTHREELLKIRQLQVQAENDLKYLQEHPVEPKTPWIRTAVQVLFDLDHQLSKDK